MCEWQVELLTTMVLGVLMRLIKNDILTYGIYLEFRITDRWIQSF